MNATIDVISSLITCLRYRLIIVRRSKHGRAIRIARRIVARIKDGGKTKRSGHSNEKRSRGHTEPVRRVTRSRNGGSNTPETRVRARFRNHCVSWFIQINGHCGSDNTTAASQFARQYIFYVWYNTNKFAFIKEKIYLSLLNLIVAEIIFSYKSFHFCLTNIKEMTNN